MTGEITWAVCADGGFLCPSCVKAEHKMIDQVDPECPDDDQWRIIGYQRPEPDQACDHCHATP